MTFQLFSRSRQFNVKEQIEWIANIYISDGRILCAENTEAQSTRPISTYKNTSKYTQSKIQNKQKLTLTSLTRPEESGGGKAGHQLAGMVIWAKHTPSCPSGLQAAVNGLASVIGSDRGKILGVACSNTQTLCWRPSSSCLLPVASLPAWNKTRSTGESRGIVVLTWKKWISFDRIFGWSDEVF